MLDPALPEDALDAADRQQLEAWRHELDQRNRVLLSELQARARLVLQVARFKAARGLPLFDAARERAMLAALLEEPGTGLSAAELAPLLKLAMRAYRRAIQRTITAPGG